MKGKVIVLLGAGLMLFGCHQLTRPPIPPARTVKRLGAITTNPPAKVYSLAWEFAVCPPTNVVTEVYTNDAAFNFWLFAVTTDTNLVLGTNVTGNMFFKVRTRDLLTGLASDWGTAK